MADSTDASPTVTNGHQDASADLLRELVAHLRNNRTVLRQEWARRIGEARLLTALTQEEIFGHRELVALLQTCAGLPPDAVANRVEAAVLAASEGRLRDDMAILAFGPTPQPKEIDG